MNNNMDGTIVDIASIRADCNYDVSNYLILEVLLFIKTCFEYNIGPTRCLDMSSDDPGLAKHISNLSLRLTFSILPSTPPCHGVAALESEPEVFVISILGFASLLSSNFAPVSEVMGSM